ncbi:MAG TPA: DUF3806 domain-containing protein [Polyangiaceae bacterium]|jgi:hypothetical protein
MPQTTFPLDGSEWSLMREQVATIQALVTRKYGAPAFEQTLDDLDHLQRLLDDKVWDESEEDKFRALGSAFGNVLAKELVFEWVAENDGRGGRRPALILKATKALVVQPHKMIVDRVQRGEEIDLRKLADDVKAQVQKTKLLPKLP